MPKRYRQRHVPLSENPKSVLRAAAASLACQPGDFSEDRPAEIKEWCERMCGSTPEEAVQMVPRVSCLDYEKLDDEVIEAVEGALFYVMPLAQDDAWPQEPVEGGSVWFN